MSKKKIFLLILFFFIFTNAYAKQLTNNVIVSIDNSIITDLDINKEINFLKFINKDQVINNPEVFKKEIINSLVDRKIKDIETNNLKIEVLEKEVENNLYNYLERMKINNDILNSFYNQNEIEKDYLKNIIKIDMKWSKLIRQMYESRLNVNLTEVNKELEKEQKNAEDDEKLKKQLIITEQNKQLNKFSVTHLEKSKKKYLIKVISVEHKKCSDLINKYIVCPKDNFLDKDLHITESFWSALKNFLFKKVNKYPEFPEELL